MQKEIKKEAEVAAATEKITFPDDAFLMVTQANWEEDIVWNGEDIKHKVLQKLNSKTNAAGWVPTSFNRTAGNFAGSSGSQGRDSTLYGMNSRLFFVTSVNLAFPQ